MTVYLLDANHASPLVTLHHPLRQRVMAALNTGNTFAINVLILSETLYGIRVVPRATKNRVPWAKLQTQLAYYDLDESDADRAVDLQIQLRKQGRQHATIDALIAVTTLRMI